MPEPQRQRITELFEAALREEPAQRSAFLKRVCGDDQALLANLTSLITHFEQSEGLTETQQPSASAIAGLSPMFDGQGIVGTMSSWEGPEAMIDSYELLAKLGAGAMGVVYKAQQLQPVRRIVAVKKLQSRMESNELISRFEGERQVLANMNHANIARFFDAGTTAAGRPYFAMELVEGVPITAYCDANSLSLRDRIELFIPVCRAIQHAHQKGIIHRDIKPSNVLVTEQDGKGIPKVIDFGIAKATAERSTESGRTHQTTVIGTLEYMSPEQTDLLVHDIDTRSDIYTLGAVLYELLTGTTPLEFARSEKLEDCLRRIREEEPSPPSTRLGVGSGRVKEIAAFRRTDPARLPKMLRGDLDWIVMKALAKDPTWRYQTANDLLRDLQLFLSLDPVEAAPQSTIYRIRKRARKHRLWLAAGAAFVTMLLAAVVFILWNTVQATRARRQSDAVLSFLQKDLLEQASPNNQSRPDQGPDPDLKVRTLLGRAGARIAGRFNSQPQVEASIRGTIGSAYADLGVYPEAAHQLESALSVFRRALGAKHPDTLAAMNNLASVYWKQGKYPQAEALNVQVIELRRQVLGPEHPDTLESLNNLATVYDSQGKYSQAEPLFTKILEAERRVQGPEHPNTLGTMNNLAADYDNQGKYPQAEALDREVVEKRRRLLGAEHPDTIATMTNLAGVYLKQGKYYPAEALLSQVLDIERHALGTKHPDTLSVMSSLAVTYQMQGKYPQAEALLLQTFELENTVLGPEHPTTLSTKHNLASVYYFEGKYSQAIVLFAQVLDVSRLALGPEHPETLSSMNSLATVYESQGKSAQAEVLYRQTLNIQRRVLGLDHPNTLGTMNNLASVYMDQGKYPQAEALYVQTLQGQRRVLGAEHPDTLGSMGGLAGIYQKEGKYPQAEMLYSQALAIQRRVLGAEHSDTQGSIYGMAKVYQGSRQICASRTITP